MYCTTGSGWGWGLGGDGSVGRSSVLLKQVRIPDVTMAVSPRVSYQCNLQALVYDILPSTSHIYVRAWVWLLFSLIISTQTFRRALTASVHGQLRGDKECLFSGVTKSGSSEEGAGKRCSEYAISADSLNGVRTTPVYNRMHWHACTRGKSSQTNVSHTVRKYCTH